jgi:hypothetical protein
MIALLATLTRLLGLLAGLLILSAVLAALTRVLGLLSGLMITLTLVILFLLSALIWIVHLPPGVRP